MAQTTARQTVQNSRVPGKFQVIVHSHDLTTVPLLILGPHMSVTCEARLIILQNNVSSARVKALLRNPSHLRRYLLLLLHLQLPR